LFNTSRSFFVSDFGNHFVGFLSSAKIDREVLLACADGALLCEARGTVFCWFDGCIGIPWKKLPDWCMLKVRAVFVLELTGGASGVASGVASFSITGWLFGGSPKMSIFFP